MSILITGGLGFIRIYLAHALLQKGEDVVLFDVVSSSPLIKDIRDTEIVRSWPKYLKETKAFEDWGWKTKFLLKETVEDFIKEVQAHPDIYG